MATLKKEMKTELIELARDLLLKNLDITQIQRERVNDFIAAIEADLATHGLSSQHQENFRG